MLGKHIAASLMATAMLATTAIAQTPSSSSPSTPSASPPPPAASGSSATSTPSSSSSTSTSAASSSSYQGNWRTSKVVGLNVYNDKDESLGEINDLLTDKQGKIVAAVIGVGGFLGVGERYAAIPFEKLKFVNEPRSSASANNSTNAGNRPVGTTGAASGSTATGSAATGSAATGSATSGSTGAGSSTSMAPAAPSRSTSNANDWAPDHAMLNVSKDEIKNMAEFKYTK